MLLLLRESFRCTEIQLRSAVGAVQDAREQAHTPRGAWPALALPELMHPEPKLLRDYGLLLVGYYLLFLLGNGDRFMDLVAHGGASEIDCAACVLPVIEDIGHGISRPSVRDGRRLRICRPSLRERMLRGSGNTVGFEDTRDLRRSFAGKGKRENPLNHLRGLRIDMP